MGAAGGDAGSLGRGEPTRQGSMGIAAVISLISVIYERAVVKLGLTPDIPSLFMITFFSPLYFFTRIKLYNVSENVL